MPAAVWQGEQSPRRTMQRYDIVCLHTIVGYAPAHAAHFSVKADGTIQQSRDTRYQSGANLDGNHRIIAIENEDHGPSFGSWNTRDGHAVPDFTDAQIEANAKILAWAHQEHGIPLQLCPNSKPTSRGLGYHRQGIDGNWSSYRYPGRVSGGEKWTTSPGKVCPGDRRIARRQQILDRAVQIVNGDDSMSWKETINPTKLAARRIADSYSMKAEHVVAHILGLVYNHRHGKVPFNNWMEKRWGKHAYKDVVYNRAGYGHARAGNENTEQLLKGQAQQSGELAGLRDLVEQIAEKQGTPIDMSRFEAASERGANRALAELNITVQVSPDEEPTGDDDNEG